MAFRVNGVSRSFAGNPEMPLLWYLRDKPHLAGKWIRQLPIKNTKLA